jgi:hypothetical protein
VPPAFLAAHNLGTVIWSPLGGGVLIHGEIAAAMREAG